MADLVQHVDDREVLGEVLVGEARILVAVVGLLELRTTRDLAREEAAPERTVGHEADAELARGGQDLSLDASLP